jgi:hypothetical protein
MIKVLRTARKLQEVCEKTGRPFCFIGGLAVQRWGELRMTIDADALIYTGFADEDPVIEFLLKNFEARRPDAVDFAKKYRVLLLQNPGSAIGIDISLGGMNFELRAIERSSVFSFQPNIDLRTCSAEDLIVLKAYASRDIDWHDIKGVLIRQQGKLDLGLIDRELSPLVALKEDPDVLPRWYALRDRYR